LTIFDLVRLAINENLSGTAQLRARTDAGGKFKLPPSPEQAQIFVLHESGYALVDASSVQKNGEITLTAWARIEGTVRHAGKPANGVQLELIQSSDFRPIEYRLLATTRVDGTFEFKYVPAISETICENNGGQSATSKRLSIKPGQVVDLELGHSPASSQP